MTKKRRLVKPMFSIKKRFDVIDGSLNDAAVRAWRKLRQDAPDLDIPSSLHVIVMQAAAREDPEREGFLQDVQNRVDTLREHLLSVGEIDSNLSAYELTGDDGDRVRPFATELRAGVGGDVTSTTEAHGLAWAIARREFELESRIHLAATLLHVARCEGRPLDDGEWKLNEERAYFSFVRWLVENRDELTLEEAELLDDEVRSWDDEGGFE
ncbi:MAG: hypothetical protein ACRELB_19505, partial [Polyangiaceae bacterium]